MSHTVLSLLYKEKNSIFHPRSTFQGGTYQYSPFLRVLSLKTAEHKSKLKLCYNVARVLALEVLLRRYENKSLYTHAHTEIRLHEHYIPFSEEWEFSPLFLSNFTDWRNQPRTAKFVSWHDLLGEPTSKENEATNAFRKLVRQQASANFRAKVL